ncbi:MAG: methyltransferase domain-containing protein [Calditrichaeota bacterium]|nr:methyltransferase domain-containing protein [Calditrichota bacterium]
MNQDILINNAFSKQSHYFDTIEIDNPILEWIRRQIREHLETFLVSESHILELNSGTGLDAIYFAKKGHRVFATDIAEGMIEQIKQKVSDENLSERIKVKHASFEKLKLNNDQQFNYVFSNFSGLNCAADLEKVINQFIHNLQANSYVTFVLLPKICPWEIIYLLKGKFRFAFRRFSKNSTGRIAGSTIRLFYHSINKIKRAFGNQFRLIKIQGVACFSFPPFMLKYAHKYPRFYRILTRIDERLCNIFPFNRLCDLYIVTMQYKPK